jgi:chromosome segregation ATPase
MAEKKEKTSFKILGLLFIVVALGAMVSLWYLNYRDLQKAVVSFEDAAFKQAKIMRFYASEYKVVKVDLDQKTAKLAQVSQELETANLELSNTRGDLAELEKLNEQLKSSIQGLEQYRVAALAKGETLEDMIKAYKNKNEELERDLQAIRQELLAFKPEIMDLAQGRTKVSFYKKHIRTVKKNMSVIKNQALEVKKAAQKERDRLEMMYGNNGYLVKNGQDLSVTSFDQKKVEINVNFVDK